MTKEARSQPDAPVRRAIILAAGRGCRLKSVQRGPKCLSRIGDRSLLEWQLDALSLHGVEEIYLVVGYEAAAVERAARGLCRARRQRLTILQNPAYAETNTLVSLSLAAQALEQPAVCINGDLLFDGRCLRALFGSSAAAAVAVERRPCGEEEVKVRCDEDGRIRAISKAVPPAQALGEAIGLNAFRGTAALRFSALLRHMAANPQNQNAYFELALEALCQHTRVQAVLLDGAPAVEIDFPEDLERARRDILPLLRSSGE